MANNPRLVVVAGPNGSGKSTFTRAGGVADIPVIDPDAIARTLDPLDPASVAASAGREALRQQNTFLEQGQSFSVETTLSGNSPIKLMERAASLGYEVELHYIRTGTVEANIDRIANRVAQGGHYIPTEDVQRRYDRSLENLPRAIANADQSVLYDNSRRLEQVARLHESEFEFKQDVPYWAAQAAYKAAEIMQERAVTDDQSTEATLRQAEASVAVGALSKDDLDLFKEAVKVARARDDDYGL